jgi:hypothetical protein
MLSPEHLSLLRKTFEDLNKEIIEQADKLITTGRAMLSVGSVDYHEAILTLKTKKFYSLDLHQLFEYMLLYHFFKFNIIYSLDIPSYIKSGTFDKERYMADSQEHVSILEALSYLTLDITEIFKKYKLSEKYLEDENMIHLVNYMRKAKSIKLYHSGDVDFILSKIPLNGKGFLFSGDLNINDNIFYTYKPNQILAMARISNPGIYLIANIPNNKPVETSFYLLIVTEGDAYLIDCGKHSYREQIYRTSSKGEDGEWRWLRERFENKGFPLGRVLGFYETKSQDTAISIADSNFSFRTIGKISEDCSENIIWLHTFIDACIETLKNSDMLNEVSVAVIPEYVKTGIQLSAQELNLPAIYVENIPIIKSLDWSREKTQVAPTLTSRALEPYLKPIPDSDIQLCHNNLTSFKQIEAGLIFEKRKREAEYLQEALNAGHKENKDSVNKRLTKFFSKKFTGEFFYKKAFANKKYPMRKYLETTFSYPSQESIENREILFVSTKRSDIFSPTKITMHPKNCGSSGTFFINTEISQNNPIRIYTSRECDICGVTASFQDTLLFLDILQIKSFFELTDEDLQRLPHELAFLDPVRSTYTGNSILDDIDPVALIENPWWGKDTPQINVTFYLCKRCQKKHGGPTESVKKAPPVNVQGDDYDY